MSASTSLSTAPSRPATLPPQVGTDRRSSSLSDVGERLKQDDMDAMNVGEEDSGDDNDTEAETERLDDTPIKSMEQRIVVRAPGSTINELTQNRSPARDDQSPSLSEASSPPDSSGNESHPHSVALYSKKRKRSDEDNLEDGDGTSGDPVGRRTSSNSDAFRKSPSYSRQQDNLKSLSSRVSSPGAAVGVIQDRSAEAPSNSSARSDKVLSDDEVDMLETTIDAGGDESQLNENDIGAPESNADDMEADDNIDADPEGNSRNQEEVAKKKSALDSLSALEKCFATLRDRLFDERLSAANEELSLLSRSDLVHPELLAVKEAIDRHRQQKVKYQQTFLKLKLETLQRESVATKHQIQSQYMQTVRELRDGSLDKLNKEFYQVQRERRNGEKITPEGLDLFSSDRGQQVRQQTAYNHEVSILAGVAKYKGFPTAPELKGIRTGELEEDLRSMGIANRPTQTWQSRPAPFRAEAAGPSPLHRQISSAEEVFLERNAWANPHHPAHQQRFNRQSSSVQPSSRKSQQQEPDPKTRHLGTASIVPDLVSSARTSTLLEQNGSSTARTGVEAGALRKTTAQADSEQERSPLEPPRQPSLPHDPLKIRMPHTNPSMAHNSDNRDKDAIASFNTQSTYGSVNTLSADGTGKLPVKIEDAQGRASPKPLKFGPSTVTVAAGSGQLS